MYRGKSMPVEFWEDDEQHLIADIVLPYTDGYPETIFPFSKHNNTPEAGTHPPGFLRPAPRTTNIMLVHRPKEDHI